MKRPALLSAVALCLPIAAHAQSTLTYEQLIAGLKPTAAGPTRGIHEIGSQAARPAASTQPVIQASTRAARPAVHTDPAPAAPASGDLASVALRVQFESGSAKLTPAAVGQLDELGKALTSPALAASKFRIEGHTDSVGSREMNEALSAKRAAAVIDYLAQHFGVDRSRLTAVGLGPNQPLIPTPDGVPEPRNRRVQVVNIGA